MKKVPFPWKLRATRANMARVKRLLYEAFPVTDAWALTPELLAKLCRSPLLRATYLWRQKLGHSGLSPFGLAALAGVSVEEVLEQLQEEGWLHRFTYCSTTQLPTCQWRCGYDPVQGYRLLLGFTSTATPESLVGEYAPQASTWLNEPIPPDFQKLLHLWAEFQETGRHPRFFKVPKRPGEVK